MKIKAIALALAAATVAAPLAHAADYLSLDAGYYDALRHKYPAAIGGVEYRFDTMEYGVRPMVGGFATSDGGAYGYAGFDWDVAIIPNQFYIIPNFAAGLYSVGSGRNLGGPIEFRSGIELDYQLPNTQRIGVALNHISNADIYKHNPGEENIIATYSIPVGTVGRWINGR